MSATNCRVVNFANQCPELGAASTCTSCTYDDGETICDGYTVVTCQMPPAYLTTSLDSEVPWMYMTSTVSSFNDVREGTNVTFTSNREFQGAVFEYDAGEYVNQFNFSSPNPVTDLTWTWVTAPDYMYFYYPNMSIARQPFGYPTMRPTFMDDDAVDDDAIDQCDSPCPTHCENGYTKGYTMGGCTVYCKDQPTNGQCLPGGTGCSSSCRSISIGAIAGIVIGSLVFVVIVSVGVWWKFCRASKPMTQRENEMPKGAV